MVAEQGKVIHPISQTSALGMASLSLFACVERILKRLWENYQNLVDATQLGCQSEPICSEMKIYERIPTFR